MHCTSAFHVRVNQFAGFLREQDFCADPSSVLVALAIANTGYFKHPRLLRAGFRACFCSTPEQWQRFDMLFDHYWQSAYQVDHTPGHASDKPATASIADGQQMLVGLGGTSEKQQQHDDIYGAGDYKALSLADFRFVFDPAQQLQVQAMVDAMARRVRRQFFRKQHSSNKGGVIDLRRTVQRSIRTRGLPVNLRYRRQRKRLPRFVLLLDISQSMDVYAKLFLRFARQVMAVFTRSQAYVFNTELVFLGEGFHDISEQDFEQQMNAESRGWLGGTRIAASLDTFNEQFLDSAVDSKTIVLVFSDGCDTEPPQQLAVQVEKIQRRARRLVWVNPLLGRVEPGTPNRYMDPVEPYVDIYCSAHNLQSLQSLGRLLLG